MSSTCNRVDLSIGKEIIKVRPDIMQVMPQQQHHVYHGLSNPALKRGHPNRTRLKLFYIPDLNFMIARLIHAEQR